MRISDWSSDVCSSDLGIAAFDGGRGNDDLGAVDVRRLMPDRDLDSLFSQSLDDIAIGDVAALHLIAEIVHDLGDTRHADAADADEMDGADVGRDAAHHLSPARVDRKSTRLNS